MTNPSPGAEDERAIRAADEAWSRALERNDLDGLMASYAEDAVLLPMDAPAVVGREAIRARFARRLAIPGFSASFATTRVVVAQSRDMAYELGTFRVSWDDERGRPVARAGKHLVTWEKSGGRWQVTAESINYDAG